LRSAFFVAIRMTWTALPITSAGLFWPWGPLGMGVAWHESRGRRMRIDLAFIGTSLIFLIAGMIFGIWMGAIENFQFASIHAHLNLLGFVIPTLYGLIYRAYPTLARSRLAWPQYIAHFVGLLIFIPGFVLVILTGNPTVVIPGAILILLATLTYGFIFFTGARSPA
jgi:hypothetical protein